jgi:ABC-type Fe3+/spermidine/putrescine transport system ATPase subunit
MRQEIRRVCKAFGLTAIYVTHDMKEALSVSDRLAILHRGRIEQCGPPAEVYRRPRTQFAADFMGETNFIAATVRSIDSDGVQFETALGRFRSAHAGEPLAIGQKRLLSIRPEAWTLSETATAENSVAGHLAERTYLGEMAQYAFLTGTHHLKVYEVNPRYFTQSETRTLHASVDPEDVVPVVEDAA